MHVSDEEFLWGIYAVDLVWTNHLNPANDLSQAQPGTWTLTCQLLSSVLLQQSNYESIVSNPSETIFARARRKRPVGRFLLVCQNSLECEVNKYLFKFEHCFPNDCFWGILNISIEFKSNNCSRSLSEWLLVLRQFAVYKHISNCSTFYSKASL